MSGRELGTKEEMETIGASVHRGEAESDFIIQSNRNPS